ncbi:MAG: hypothetical protein AAFX76_04930 [Planctomycetota bacterium]
MTQLRSQPAPGSMESGAPESPGPRRWRTVFVDGEALGALHAAADPGIDEARAPVSVPPRVVARLDDEVAGVRKNVRDAAGAVIAWLAAVVGHEGKTDLDDVLDRCLRPGPDVERVNYAALAEDIRRVTGVELTAKRVQTAVAHLRDARRRKTDDAQARTADLLRQKLDELDARVRGHFDALTRSDPDKDTASARRDVATEALTAVRAAAGRVIDRGFGEGIPDHVDLPALEGRFLGFVCDTLRADADGTLDHSLENDLRRLLITLADHDATAEADTKLVMHGSAVVAALLGPDSLPGVMARLNVLVTGRALLHTDLYVAEMLRLATAAESLRDDPATKTYLNWARRLPEDRRLPSAVRVASYCRSNAATRLYDRLFTGELDPDAPTLADAHQPPRSALRLADDTHNAMLAHDSGFTLTLTGELIRHVVHARLTHDDTAAAAYLRALGPDKALDRLEALIRFDNHDELVDSARTLIVSVFPELRRKLVCVR